MIPTLVKSPSLFIFSLLLAFCSYGSYAQESLSSLNSSGGHISSSSGSVSYSVGQVFYASTTSTSHNLQEGVQQANTITSSDNEDIGVPVTPSEVSVRIYPNPTTDFVTLSTQGLQFDTLNSYRVFNYQGQLIIDQSINQNDTTIGLSHLQSGLYLIQVFVNEQLWDTYKIIKH